MKKINFLLTFGVLIALFSCSKEKSKEQSSTQTIVNENDQIFTYLVNDPLFKKFDKAYYEMNLDLLKYSNITVDRAESEKINDDLRSFKFKTIKEFAGAKEKIGYSDYYKRRITQFNALKTKRDLFYKYPELKQIPLKNFMTFYNKNRKYKISSIDIEKHLEKSKDKEKQKSAMNNEAAMRKYDSDILEVLKSASYLIYSLSNQKKHSNNPIILANEDFKNLIIIENFLSFEKRVDGIILINSFAIEGIKNSYLKP